MAIAELIADRSIPEPNSGCWLWLAGCYGNGYGCMSINGRQQPAHVASYEAHYGSVPSGLELDHRCRNKLCVNPDHLDPVTHAENVRRWAASRTHCKRGHAIAEHNYERRDGYRQCRECHRLDEAKRRARARNAR